MIPEFTVQKTELLLLHKMLRSSICHHLFELTNNHANHNKIIRQTQRHLLLKASMSQNKFWNEFCKQINRKFQMNRSCRGNQWELREEFSRLQDNRERLSLNRLLGHIRTGKKKKKTTVRLIDRLAEISTSVWITWGHSLAKSSLHFLMTYKATFPGSCWAMLQSLWSTEHGHSKDQLQRRGS